jgi:hypothetical protein
MQHAHERCDVASIMAADVKTASDPLFGLFQQVSPLGSPHGRILAD